MHQFAEHLRKHFSPITLGMLVVLSLVALGALGKSITILAANIIDQNNALATPYAAVPHVKPALPLAPPPMEIPDRSLAPGEKSKEVLELQSFLVWKGLLPADATSTYFGSATLGAVKKYQIENHLPPEGIVGPKTREVWKSDITKVQG